MFSCCVLPSKIRLSCVSDPPTFLRLFVACLQCGQITRIVVGCDKHVNTGHHRTHQGGDADRLIKQDELLKSSHPRVKIHVAPSIPEAKDFPWFNKPWSFHHWLLHNDPKETAIVILDPDEFFLQPLTQSGRKRKDLLSHWPKSMDKDITDVVRPGRGVAQMYGFGSVWLNMFKYKELCPGKQVRRLCVSSPLNPRR